MENSVLPFYEFLLNKNNINIQQCVVSDNLNSKITLIPYYERVFSTINNKAFIAYNGI